MNIFAFLVAFSTTGKCSRIEKRSGLADLVYMGELHDRINNFFALKKRLHQKYKNRQKRERFVQKLRRPRL
ncbi:Oidioi.mRNA.OKI2018_I69.chr2.g4812.t1.cds [Oikopleura dioica]|uniref:Oidioi.mRNA.OKI2018_I69.chr2.g4812.t1.cds n=1 Tax=Oikopleura dioica TaxID=34765 RepID=A0ABN7SYK4_OIKDI|nr:Oidioi.mRNA.OKI2018_I69.chr2.g4812.t1.cds [Oikopleura dioica]